MPADDDQASKRPKITNDQLNEILFAVKGLQTGMSTLSSEVSTLRSEVADNTKKLDTFMANVTQVQNSVYELADRTERVEKFLGIAGTPGRERSVVTLLREKRLRFFNLPKGTAEQTVAYLINTYRQLRVELRPSMFLDCEVHKYSSAAQQDKQMLVCSVADMADKKKLIGDRGATAQALKQRFDITFGIERSIEESKALAAIRKHPAFIQAAEQAKTLGVKPYVGYSTITLGPRGQEVVWSTDYLQQLDASRQAAAAAMMVE